MSGTRELKFKKFGKYLLLDHIVDGGMAKIWRARFLGEQANKIVAIKMIQAQFSEDAGFRQMFEDELRLAFGLIHPNIAQTYDYGIVDGQLFTAMEYVDGANLKQYMDRLKKRNFVFPVEISSHIISQVCQALHYAHTFTDKLTGKSLNIIHRDISPHNVMLTYDGSIKVIDFGIAKSESNSEATQAGTIKGKLSYLAPEYLDGLELDCRYDVFAVGITLWELLCNQRLFQAKNDLAVLKKIQKCEVPAPSTINPNVPKELDEIVLKALAKDRDDRFENMDKFNRAVVRFLYANYPDFNPTDLSYFAHELFKEDIKEDRKKLVNYGKIDIAPYLKEGAGEGKIERNIPVSRPERVELDFTAGENTINLGPELVADIAPAKTRTNITRGHSRTKIQTKTSITNKNSVSTGRHKKKAAKEKKVNWIMPAAAAVIALFVGYKTGLYEKFMGQKVAVHETKVIGPEETTLVYLDGFNPLMKVMVDGKEVEYSDFSGLKIAAGKRQKIVVEQAGKIPFEIFVNFSIEETGKRITIPELSSGEYGLLTTSRNFAEGTKIKFSVEGQNIEKTLPIENYRIPAGTYDAFIIDPILNTQKKINFRIEPSKKLFLRK